MEAIILAGGFGKRLREVVPDLPKPMAPVAGRPFLEILLTTLSRKGFTRIILSLGYMSEKIISHFGDNFAGMDLIYEVEKHPLGTGGAIRTALTRCKSDHVYIFNGDTFLDIEVADIERLWQTNHRPVIVVRSVQDTVRFGRIEMRDGCISSFLEKGINGGGLINAGCYVFPKDILDTFQYGMPFSLESDFFCTHVNQLQFDGFVTKGKFIDIGIPEDFLIAQTELKGI